jgi:hypothetical protein
MEADRAAWKLADRVDRAASAYGPTWNLPAGLTLSEESPANTV